MNNILKCSEHYTIQRPFPQIWLIICRYLLFMFVVASGVSYFFIRQMKAVGRLARLQLNFEQTFNKHMVVIVTRSTKDVI